jgi:hypothetical protein
LGIPLHIIFTSVISSSARVGDCWEVLLMKIQYAVVTDTIISASPCGAPSTGLQADGRQLRLLCYRGHDDLGRPG